MMLPVGHTSMQGLHAHLSHSAGIFWCEGSSGKRVYEGEKRDVSATKETGSIAEHGIRQYWEVHGCRTVGIFRAVRHRLILFISCDRDDL